MPLMKSPIGTMMHPASLPMEDVHFDSSRYPYEGYWLFSSFDDPYILAARAGFGQGRFAWQDYGLPNPDDPGVPFSYRLEIITAEGIKTSIFSERPAAPPVKQERAPWSLALPGLFSIAGWPAMQWRFQSQDASLALDLHVTPLAAVVWPDALLPHNIFSMAISAFETAGTIRIGKRASAVRGGGFFDHPRIVTGDYATPAFGWYLFCPIRFPDGTFLAGYHTVNGDGRLDETHSMGVLVLPGGGWRRLSRFRVSGLQFQGYPDPTAWSIEASGDDLAINLDVEVKQIPGAPKEIVPPLLMSAQGECQFEGSRSLLKGGSGIAEFLVRKGHDPVYP